MARAEVRIQTTRAAHARAHAADFNIFKDDTMYLPTYAQHLRPQLGCMP